MPIYDYVCRACGRPQSRLFMKLADVERSPRCRHCQRRRLTRLLSGFAYHQGEQARLDNLDTSAARDESFYRDNRNVGLWAKKRARDMGVDLGPQFDETVEKARTGKILDDP